MDLDLSEYDHPAWFTVTGTFVGYAAIILGMFLLLFVLPYLVFVALG
jgi:hypothetical protein